MYIHGWLWISGGHCAVSCNLISTQRGILIDLYNFMFKVPVLSRPGVAGKVKPRYVQKVVSNGYAFHNLLQSQ
jgi:hypothetical protein